MSAARVARHAVFLYGHPGALSAPSHQHGHIVLWNSLGAKIGIVNFIEPGRPLLHDKLESDGRIMMEMPASMMPLVLDLLRHESPVYLLFRAGQGFLMTQEELAGGSDWLARLQPPAPRLVSNPGR